MTPCYSDSESVYRNTGNAGPVFSVQDMCPAAVRRRPGRRPRRILADLIKILKYIQLL